MRVAGVAASFGLALVLVGCGTAPKASPAATSGSSGAAGSAAGASSASASTGPASPSAEASDAAPAVWLPDWAGDDVPAEVAERRPLPFCGIERPPQPQPGEFIDRAVRLCFWNAHLGKTEAEFVSLQSTMEGRPIATIYRIAADGSVEIFTDFTQDPFGGGAWQATTCDGVVEDEGAALLGPTGCAESRQLE